MVGTRVTSSQLEDSPSVHPSGIGDGEQGGQGEETGGDQTDSVIGFDKVEQCRGDTTDQDGKVKPFKESSLQKRDCQ